jgi:drug/metabolite transporter (DMT)-like permease
VSKQIGILSVALTAVAATAFVLTWSSGFLVAAIATVDVPPTTLLAWRFIPVAIALLLIASASGSMRGITRAQLGTQAVIGLFAQFGYCASVYGAIAVGITTGTTALIDAVQPLVVATLVGPLLGLRVRGAQWAGLGIGAAGVVLVVQSQIGGSDAAPIAYALPALAMACLLAGTFVERRAREQPPVIVALTIHVCVTAIGMTMLAGATGTLLPPASVSFWIATVFAALSPTLAAYGLYWWLLRRVGVTILNALLFLIAPTTAIAGALLLGEPLTALTFAGFILCGAGVAVVLASSRLASSGQPARTPVPLHPSKQHSAHESGPGTS